MLYDNGALNVNVHVYVHVHVLQYNVNILFQLHSTFHCRVKGPQIMTSISVIIVHGFWPKTENVDFGQKGYLMKGHLKRNRMAQISAS